VTPPPTTPQPHVLTERPIQFRGGALSAHLLKLAGWTVLWDGLPTRQGLLVFYPHTSNWDFPLCLLARRSVGVPAAFWAKDSLFAWPLFGRWLRWVNGLPVDRSAPGGLVPQMVERMRMARERDELLWLALTPEGTRSHGTGWRSGFYRIAVEAEVPVALVHMDFGRKVVGVHSVLRLCGDPAADMAEIARRYAGVRGYRPESAAPITLS
jgi:1-acyl-sn-glycerol-3-phosphate acyltransferase